MIVELHKYLIYGNREQMERFFTLAQRGGFLEFIGTSHKKKLELPEEAKTFLSAIRIAKRYPIHSRETQFAPIEPLELAQTIVSLRTAQEDLAEERRLLQAEIARTAPFGDFSRKELDDLERQGNRTLQFFCRKSDLEQKPALPPEVIFIATDYELDYFIAIHKEPMQYPKMVEIKIERPVGELRSRLAEVEEESERVEAELSAYSQNLPILQKGLTDRLDEHHLHLAKHGAVFPLNQALFAVETWVPTTRIRALHALLGSLNAQCEEIAIETRDQIPTYMENKGAAKIGEDLVEIYDTPSHLDKDPSIWILIFFSLFFAMIISDAGYGTLYFLGAVLLKWKFPRLSGIGRRALHLFFICSTCCILWGIGIGSYFGIEMRLDNPLRKISFLNHLAVRKAEYHLQEKDDVYEGYLKDYPIVSSAQNGEQFLALVIDSRGRHKALDTFYDNLLMEFSFVVGILHLSCSFLRYLFRNPSGFGWVLFMVGGYLYFPSILHATTIANFLGWAPKPFAQAAGVQLIYGGVAFAFFAALLKRKWRAFSELLHIVQVFADVVSYVRLYALALAGIVMAQTFNDHLGIDMGVVASSLILLAGHFVTLGLSTMGGVIHGLRLNLLEWYHYSFEGGGRLFNPLKLHKTK